MPEFFIFAIAFCMGAAWGLATRGRIARGPAIGLSYPIAWLALVAINTLISVLSPSWNPPGRSVLGNVLTGAVFATSFALAAPVGCWCTIRNRRT